MSKQKISTQEGSRFSGFLLEKTAKRMKLNLQRQLKEMDAGITVDQWLLLNTLMEEDGISQLKISTILSKDAPTITRIIDLLTKKNLVERKSDANDRRRYQIHLTSNGRKKAKVIYPKVIDFRRQAYANIKDKDLKSIEKALHIINENLNIL